MLQAINKYIQTNNLPNAPARLIIAVSGGADSVALLHLLIELGYECIVAHCNFNLRDKESDRDKKFVTELAKELSIPVFTKDFETKSYAIKNKVSIEMAARELRYAWFEEIRTKHNAVAIAVAHHSDDMVETFLMNITRGTGIHGLSGIKAKNGNIIRPLLAQSRSEIESYLADNNIKYVTDSSNKEEVYLRNKFRNSIIPSLEEINPSLKETIIETIQRLKDVEEIYNNKTKEIIQSILTKNTDGFSIEISKLKQHTSISSILFETLAPLGFSSSTIQSLIKSLDGQPGKQFFSHSHRIIKDRKHLFVSSIKDDNNVEYSIEENQTTIESPIKLEIKKLKDSVFSINKDLNYAYLDTQLIKFPLTLRKWKNGDSFSPLGMKGKKKLSDYFIDQKFSLKQKEETWVLLSGNKIIWIIGERIDNQYRIQANSREILRIKLLS